MRCWAILTAAWRVWRAWPDGTVLRSEIQALGGLWPKVGQLLSLRRDALPAAVCDALHPLLGEKTAHGIQASIGYVVRDGDKAIKRRRPDVVAFVRADLALLQRVSRWRWLRVSRTVRQLRLRAFVDELEQVMLEELDLRYEAYRQRRMRRNLRKHKGLYVPRVYLAECTEEQLVTEWIDGPVLGDLLGLSTAALKAALAPLRLTAKRIARWLATSQLRQIFEDNLFHGDLHPRNILLRRRQVVVIDFGTVGTTDGDFLTRYLAFVRALAGKHFARASQLFCLLCQGLQPRFAWEWWPDRRLQRLRVHLALTMMRWADRTIVKTLPREQRSVTGLSDLLMQAILKAGGAMDWAWFRIQRAYLTIDPTMLAFWPSMDFLALARRYLAKADARVRILWRNPASLWRDALQLFDQAGESLRINSAYTRIEGALKGVS